MSELPTPAIVPRTERDYARELWVGLPKDKTLGGAATAFLNAAGFSTPEKIERIDDYPLADRGDYRNNGIRIFEMKPQMALGLIASRRMDAAIVGRDILKPFNAMIKGRKGVVQCSEILDLGLAPCTLSIGVPLDDKADDVRALNGRVIVTNEKYRKPLEDWAKRKSIVFAEIVSEIIPGVPIVGGIEGLRLFDPRISAICDMIESGESIVRYDWKPLGIVDRAWQDVRTDVYEGLPKKERRKYTDLPQEMTRLLPGTIIPSRPVVARVAARLCERKEERMAFLVQQFMEASRAMGNTPVLQGKRMAEQRNGRDRRGMWAPAKPLPSHGCWFD
jgi:hypothetical protein